MGIDGKERSALLAAVDRALPVETDAKGGEGVAVILSGGSNLTIYAAEITSG